MPPPTPPRLPASFDRALQELTRRLGSFEAALKGGLDPDSLKARVLQRRIGESEAEVMRRYARLNPARQGLAEPRMQAVEQDRQKLEAERARPQREATEARRQEQEKKRIEQEELQRRKQLLEEMKAETKERVGLIQSLGRSAGVSGNLTGMLTTNPYALLAGGLGMALQGLAQQRRDQEAGGRLLAPGAAKTLDVSEQLRQVQEARLSGEQGKLESQSREAQARTAARAAGLGYMDQRAQYSPRNLLSLLEATFTSKSYAKAQQEIAERHTAYYEKYLQEQGKLGPGQRFREKRDLFMPFTPRYTGAEQYEMALGQAALQQGGQEASNELLRQQLEAIGQLGVKLDVVASKLPGPAFGT